MKSLRLKAFLVFLMVHVGLGTGIYCIARLGALNGMDGVLWALVIGIALLYTGFLAGVFFIVAPVLPWIRKFQQAREAMPWAERLIHELPRIIEVLKVGIQLWNELKRTWSTSVTPVGTTAPTTNADPASAKSL